MGVEPDKPRKESQGGWGSQPAVTWDRGTARALWPPAAELGQGWKSGRCQGQLVRGRGQECRAGDRSQAARTGGPVGTPQLPESPWLDVQLFRASQDLDSPGGHSGTAFDQGRLLIPSTTVPADDTSPHLSSLDHSMPSPATNNSGSHVPLKFPSERTRSSQKTRSVCLLCARVQ